MESHSRRGFFVYIVDKYHVSSLLLGTMQTAFSAIVYALVAVFIPGLIQNWSLCSLYLLVISCTFIRLLMFLVIVFVQFDEQLYWIAAPIVGAVWSMGVLIIDIINIQQQPKRDTSKIAGFKFVLVYFVAAVVNGFLSYFWDDGSHFRCFGTVFACLDASIIIIIASMMFIKIYYYGTAFSVASVQ
jgi:hypothetical protein